MLIPARFIDHTLLRADTTAADILRMCEEAVEYGFAAVCIPPVHVPLAAQRLYGSDVVTATVIGFPLGYATTASKVFASQEAVASGAGEIDLVIQLGAARDGDLDRVEDEIRQIVTAASPASVKVIIECCLFEALRKQELTERVVAGGAAMVKTSTGFGSGGATVEDVRLLAATASGRIGVKAAGGIRDWSFCRQLLEVGATRIGTSAGVAIVEAWRQEGRG